MAVSKEKALEAKLDQIQKLGEQRSKAKTEEEKTTITEKIGNLQLEAKAIKKDIEEAKAKKEETDAAKSEKAKALYLKNAEEEFNEIVEDLEELVGRTFDLYNKLRAKGYHFAKARLLKKTAFALEFAAKRFGYKRPPLSERPKSVDTFVETKKVETRGATPPKTAPFQLRTPTKDTKVAAPKKESKVKHNADVFRDTRKGVSNVKGKGNK